MISDGGHYVDGSWSLSVRIDALKLDRKMRVQGDWSIGRVLVNLTEDLSHPTKSSQKPTEISLCPGLGYTSWSDFALWWPTKKRWVLQTHASLNQYGIHADTCLHLIPTHGRLRVQLPDLQIREFCDVNFTEPVFRVLISICKHLEIIHPEELSLQHWSVKRLPKKFEQFRSHDDGSYTLPHKPHHNNFKLTNKSQTLARTDRPNAIVSTVFEEKMPDQRLKTKCGTVQHTHLQTYGPPKVRNRNSHYFASARQHSSGKDSRPGSLYMSPSLYGTTYKLEYIEDPTLVCSPQVLTKSALENGQIYRFVNFYQRACAAASWLELGRSLMEQGLSSSSLIESSDDLYRNELHRRSSTFEDTENQDPQSKSIVPTVKLRFKYGIFYDLTAKNNSVRINQLYEHARWSIISEEIECTNEEAALFASLQLQLQMCNLNAERDSGSFAEQTSSPLSSELEPDGPPPVLAYQMRPTSSHYLSDMSIGFPRSLGTLNRNQTASVQQLDTEIDCLLDELASSCIQDRTMSPTLRSMRSCSTQETQGYFPPICHNGFDVSDSLRTPTNNTSLSEKDVEIALPDLRGYLKICKPRYLGLRAFKRVYVVLMKTTILVYKTLEDCQSNQPPIDQICLLGCESQPDISVNADRFILKVFVPVARARLPLSRALTANDNEDLGFTSRLKRRASLLSLTSLGGLGAVCGRVVSRVSGLLSEFDLRLPDVASYVDWFSAIRLASSLSALAPKSTVTPEAIRRMYESERKATNNFLQLLSSPPGPRFSVDQVEAPNVLASEWLKKHLPECLPLRISGESLTSGLTEQNAVSNCRSQNSLADVAQLRTKDDITSRIIKHILSIHGKLEKSRAIEIKLQYISRWQKLTGNGIIYFLARFETSAPLEDALGLPNKSKRSTSPVPFQFKSAENTRQVTISMSRRIEAVGIGNGRVSRYDKSTGEVHATWRLDSVQGWHVNRELNQLVLILALSESTGQGGGPGGRVVIKPTEVPVQKVAEVLGANVFLSLRSPTKSQNLDESRFYKLIGNNRNSAIIPGSITA